MTREECLNALKDIIARGGNQEELFYWACGFQKEIKLLTDLIEEHFSNPPLKFEELKEGMWIWDNYWEEYFEISEVYSNTKEIDVLIHQNKINQKRYETIKYTPNRFYRKEVVQE